MLSSEMRTSVDNRCSLYVIKSSMFSLNLRGSTLKRLGWSIKSQVFRVLLHGLNLLQYRDATRNPLPTKFIVTDLARSQSDKSFYRH